MAHAYDRLERRRGPEKRHRPRRHLSPIGEGEWDGLLADLSDRFSPSGLYEAKALCKPGFDGPTSAGVPGVR